MKIEMEVHIDVSPYATVEQLQAVARAFPGIIEVRLVPKHQPVGVNALTSQPLSGSIEHGQTAATERETPQDKPAETASATPKKTRTKKAEPEAQAPAPTPIEVEIAERAAPVAVPADVVSVTSAPVPQESQKDKAMALVTAIAKNPALGVPRVVEIFASLGVKRFSELTEAQYGTFIAAAEAVVATVQG